MKKYIVKYFGFLAVIILSCFMCCSSFAQLSPGDIASNIKYLKVDDFGEFGDGFAVVTNSHSKAIINASGEIVFPFNKLLIYDKFREGVICVSDAQGHYGYLNKDFKLITQLNFDFSGSFVKDKFATNRHSNPTNEEWFTSISSMGKQFPIPKFILGTMAFYKSGPGNYPIAFSEGLVLFNIINNKKEDKYGFLSRTGKVVIPPKYSYANSFHDGLASVVINDSNGERKWGFIDQAGKVIIPFDFSNEPDGFNGGLCLVQPITKQDFDYAYINKTGDIQLKIKLTDENKLAEPRFNLLISRGYLFEKESLNSAAWEFENLYQRSHVPFQGNFAFWPGKNGPKLMDRNGNVKDFITMLRSVGVEGIGTYFDVSCHQVIKNENILFAVKRKFGIIKTDGTLIIPPVFDKLTHFDPISGLAYALINKNNIVTEGYVNSKGIFAIVKQAKSGM